MKRNANLDPRSSFALCCSLDKSPKLHPYPSWGAHQMDVFGNPPEIVSPVRITADRCGRLWVLDTGRAVASNASHTTATPSSTTALLDESAFNTSPATTTTSNPSSPSTSSPVPTASAAQLLVYDLRNDNLLRRFVVPADQQNAVESRFDSLAVEVATAADGSAACDDAFAYLADSGKPGLVVYSWRTLESWRVQHHFFNGDPLAGEFNVSGTSYQLTVGVYGLAIGADEKKEQATSTAVEQRFDGQQQQQQRPASQQRLYFHPLSSTAEFSVDTALLHNRTRAVESTNDRDTFAAYRQNGGRGANGQSGASALADGVLFFTAPNRNALTCWRARPSGQIDESSLGVVLEDAERLVYPSDVNADASGELWLLSNNQQRFEHNASRQQPDAVLFRVWKGTVRDAIAGTACEHALDVETTSARVPTTWTSTSTSNVQGHSPNDGHDHSQHDHAHDHNHGADGGAAGGQRTHARPAPNAAAAPSLSGVAAGVAMLVLACFAAISGADF